MGFLSNSAMKAYKKGSRRAHIPEWFEPAAYVFAAIVGIFLIVSYVLDDGPPQTNQAAPLEELVITGSGGATETNGSAPAATSVPGTEDGITISVSLADETVALVEGGSATLPAGSWAAAQATTFALLTGDFSGVTIHSGKTAPILLTTWPEPSILGLVDFKRNSDDTLAFVVRVDPDGTGSEAPRDVPFTLARVDTVWAYLPG
jgi:hypothetical protein